MDWSEILTPTLPIAEIVIRGTIIYLFLLFLFRILRRQAGTVGTSDMLFVVLIADAVQNGFGKEYSSVTESMILASTIAGWDYLIDWLSYRSRWIEKILRPPPLLLVKNGRILKANLKRELMTTEELFAKLREKQIDDITLVKTCHIEDDGKVSVIKQTDTQ